MLEILKNIAGLTPPSVELRRAVADIKAEADRASAAHAEAREALKQAIYVGAEKAIGRAEAARTVAARDLDRAEIAIADLRRRIADAEAVEADAALDADAVRKEADDVRKLLLHDYTKSVNRPAGWPE